jgi:hypothetical protein
MPVDPVKLYDGSAALPIPVSIRLVTPSVVPSKVRLELACAVLEDVPVAVNTRLVAGLRTLNAVGPVGPVAPTYPPVSWTHVTPLPPFASTEAEQVKGSFAHAPMV